MKLKKYVSLILGISAFLVAASPATADQFYNYPARSTPVSAGNYRVVITENYPDNRTHMSYSPFDPSISSGMKTRLEGGFATVLTPCLTNKTVGCISEVSALVGSAWQKASPAGYAVTDNFRQSTNIDGKEEYFNRFDYSADATKGLFASNRPQLWAIAGAPNQLGTTYSVNAVLNSTAFGGIAVMHGIDIDAWATNSDGTQTVNLPENLKLRVKVRLGERISELSGWFDGRIKDAEVDFGQVEPGVISVEGNPVTVSTISTSEIPKSDPLYPMDQRSKDADALARGVHETAFGRDGLATYKRVESRILEKAVSTNTYWRLSSWSQTDGQVQCPEAKGVLGVAMTNATTYDPKAPTWNASTNSLDFQVASSHLMEDGSLNQGYYRLLISEAYAKCLWGSNATKRSAAISVLGSDGTTEVATTTFGGSNGWIHFDAAGYHYSSPKIVVKLLDEPSTTANQPTKQVATTIVCVNKKNKKLTRKVTAIAPKCPTGFKAK